MVRGLASTILSAENYTVLAARSGEEALDIARRQTRPIALLLTDMIMPGMGGAELAAELRMLQPNIKVIVTSGYSDRQGNMLEDSDAQTAFLPKPYTPDSLTKAVLAAFDPSLKQLH
jgi:two-component system cell cycle sensor histidine kinase/response regulator CckA